MSLLYKDHKDIIYEAHIKDRKVTDNIKLSFYNDGGKFGTHEMLAVYNLTPKRLLEILSDREDITESEFN